MLEVMDERILERHVEERRKVRRPEHHDEGDPGNERMAQHANDATLEGGEKAGTPAG